jgi:hypothetical protein
MYCLLCMGVYPLAIYLPTHGLVLLITHRFPEKPNG